MKLEQAIDRIHHHVMGADGFLDAANNGTIVVGYLDELLTSVEAYSSARPVTTRLTELLLPASSTQFGNWMEFLQTYRKGAMASGWAGKVRR